LIQINAVLRGESPGGSSGGTSAPTWGSGSEYGRPEVLRVVGSPTAAVTQPKPTSPAGGYSSKHYEAPVVAVSKPKRDGAALRASLDALLTQAVSAGVTDKHGVDAVYRNLQKGRFDEVRAKAPVPLDAPEPPYIFIFCTF